MSTSRSLVRLLLDSATPTGVVGVARGEQVLGAQQSAPKSGHARDLGYAAHRLLLAHEMTVADLDRITVGIGPGAFTGLRIALAHAQGLATGLNIPLEPVPTLAAMATRVPAGTRAVVALDARRGELFATVVQGAGGATELPVALLRREVLLDHLSGLPPCPTWWLGSAWETPPTSASEADFCDAEAMPSAEDLLRWVTYHRPAPCPPHLVEPLYVRPPDAALPRVAQQRP